MLLKSVKMNNIRSYINETINFPKGSLLLAGDIGSGKSTILFAVEFALFGIKRGNYSGENLLRNGKKEGYVELKFNIDDKDYIIYRKLKRLTTGVQQTAGYIIKDDVKKEGTTIELKAEILDILGYPKSLLTKSKDVIYRYTVYTPQEEMKQILFESKDIRLDTLRKVFGIDKYKRVRENTNLFIKEIKEKNKESEGRISDLQDKESQLKEREKENQEINEKRQLLLPKIEQIKLKKNEKENEIKQIEQDLKKLNELKIEFNKNNIDLKNQNDNKKSNEKNIQKLEAEVKRLEEEINKKKELKVDLDKEIEKHNKQIITLESEKNKINSKLSECNVHKTNSEKLKSDILKMSKCPTCQQNVTKEHKDKILSTEGRKIIEMINEGRRQLNKEEELNADLKKNKEMLENLRNMKYNEELNKLKIKNLKEKQNNKQDLLNQNEKKRENIIEINKKNVEVAKEIESFKDIDKIYETKRDELNKILYEEKSLEINKAELETGIENVNRLINLLKKEIEIKIKIKNNLDYLKQLKNWLENYFINLTLIMEKQIMLNIHLQFNELFQNWFNILIEDDTINVRLDDEFTPIIDQNGYESSIDNLSGGEKTSVALAYRLSLNKVINEFIGHIKTKDIIILDEPTDGFSTEQLDKIRDVLEQLNMQQVIIVSHESKIESFVDNVIRINKEEHVSKVLV